jgi:hypothetical protein
MLQQKDYNAEISELKKENTALKNAEIVFNLYGGRK